MTSENVAESESVEAAKPHRTRAVDDQLIDELVDRAQVETVWPKTIVQTCVVHLLRNSFCYAARQDRDKIARVLKPVYTAPTEEAGLERFAEFADIWGRKYPAIVRLWENAWEEFAPLPRLRHRHPPHRPHHESV
jgi:transposase-like protein